MEPYYFWTIAGFICIVAELMTARTLPLVLSGAFFFGAVIAFKFPDNYILQFVVFLAFIPIVFFALKPYFKNINRGQK